MSDEIRFYDPSAVTVVTHNRVPHWEQLGATYFITFRLADCIPVEALAAYRRERDDWLATHPQPWSADLEKEHRRRFTSRFERWLDRGYGSCMLRDPANAAFVQETMLHFEGERSRLHAWVMMPNHVHVLVSLLEQTTLPGLMKSWKGFSARQINQRSGRSGTVWQRSYFDRIVRDWDHFAGCARYIRNNPAKAGLAAGTCLQGESDLVRRILSTDRQPANSGRP